LVTQLYVQGDSLNASDAVLNGIRDAAARNSVIVPWTAIPSSRVGELSARFDIVLGMTPEEAPSGTKPAVSTRSGVVSGAAFHSGAAPGSWITLFGDNLAPATRTWAAADIVDGKLPTSLDGVSVQVNNKPAAVYFISPKQLNIQAPADETSGPVQVTVTTAAGTSDPVTTTIQRFQPAFFRFPQDYVAAVRSDGAYTGPAGLVEGVTTVPARPNDVVLMYGTGFGPTDPDVPPGQVFQGSANLVNPFTIRIGNQNAQVTFGGLVSAGLYQFNVTIPDLPDGDYPVAASIGGMRTRSVARVRIQR
jgi:uncharacterized protein (TIGR03437 family)